MRDRNGAGDWIADLCGGHGGDDCEDVRGAGDWMILWIKVGRRAAERELPTAEAMMAMAVERTATGIETGKPRSVEMKFVKLSVLRMVVVGRMAALMEERRIMVRKVKTTETCIFFGACRELRVKGSCTRTVAKLYCSLSGKSQ